MAEAKIRLSVDGATASVAALNSVQGGLNTLSGSVKSLGGGLAGLGLSLSVGSVVAYFAAINKGVDALNDLKDATGASIENISALEDVAARTGAGFDVVSTSLIKLNQALNTAKPGSDAEQALNAINLSVAELKAQDPAEAFRQVAVALSQFDDDANKARLTQILFGKSLKEVAPFLKDLSEQTKLVGTVTTEQAEATEKFNKELSSLNKNVTDVARSLAGPLVESLNTVIAKFREGRAAGRGFFEIAADRYWENVRGFYGTDTPSTGGAEGTWDDPNQSAAETARLNRRRSVGAIPDESAAKAAAAAAERAAKAAAAARKKYLDEIAKAEADALAAVQKTADARQAAYLKESNAIDAFMLSLTESASASLKSVNDRIKSLKDEEEAARLAAALNITLAESVERVAIARLQEKQAGFVTGSEGYAAIEREIEARQKLTGLIAGSEARKAAQESAKDAAKNAETEWQKAADQINQSLSDALFDAFQSGEDFGKTFVKSITSMFNSMVLKPVISAIVTPVAGAVTGSLGLSGTANAATGGSSLFSSAGSLGSLYNTLNTSTAMGGLFASNAAYGAAIGTTNIAAGSQAAMLAAQTGEFGLAGLTGTAGAAGSTLAGLAAAAPYIAAFVAAAALISKYANTSTPHAGGGSQYSAAGGLLTTGTYVPESVSEGYWQGDADGNQTWVADRKVTPGYMTGNPEPGFAAGFTSIAYNQAAVDLTTGIAKGIVSLLDSTAETFGKTAGYTAATSFADDSSSDGAWGSLRIANAVGTVLTDWQASESFRTFGDGAAGTAEYQTAIANDVRAVLQNIDLPAWANDMLTALGDTPDLTSLSTGVAQINLVAEALDTMRDKLVGFAAMSDTAVSALIKAAGGFDALAVSASTYYDNFYSEAERSTFTLTEVAKTLNALNLNLPTTREGFRALLEAQQALGNAEGVAALLKVSGAFASVIPATETLTGTVGDLGRAAEDAARAMESAVGSVNDEIKRLRGELIGNSAGGEAYLTAMFATLTGQARAGSVTAMERLPEISQAIESAAALNATSSVDLARTRAWLAGSLSTTAGGLPGEVFGTLPGASGYTSAQASGTAQLEALIQKLTTEVEALKYGVQATATHTSNINRQIERLTPDGDALAVREAAAL